MPKTDEPENPNAFPLNAGEHGYEPDFGMTLRDWFAGRIASGMAAHSGTAGASFGPGDIARRSYEVADAMLAARKARHD